MAANDDLHRLFFAFLFFIYLFPFCCKNIPSVLNLYLCLYSQTSLFEASLFSINLSILLAHISFSQYLFSVGFKSMFSLYIPAPHRSCLSSWAEPTITGTGTGTMHEVLV